MKAYEAQSQKSLQGRGRPKVSKLLAPLSCPMPMGVEVSPRHFGKGMRSEKWVSRRHPRPLDRNNSASSRQLPRCRMNKVASPGYYSEDSDLDSASMTSGVTLSASIDEGCQSGVTYDQRINWKVSLPKLNDESSTNDQWIWLADVHRYIDMSILESEIDKSLSNGFWGVWFRMN